MLAFRKILVTGHMFSGDVALFRAGKWVETTSPAVADEALGGARADPFMRVLGALHLRRCGKQDLRFLTDSGWVPVRVRCADGFFLDFVPVSKP